MAHLSIRVAEERDLPALPALIAASVDTLQKSFLTDAQIEASRAIMGDAMNASRSVSPVCDQVVVSRMFGSCSVVIVAPRKASAKALRRPSEIALLRSAISVW